jgi:hypothetical protein
LTTESDLRRARIAWLASALAFVVLAALQADKPLNLDAVEFPAMAESLLATGSPAFYRGEQLGVEVSYPFHPPFYLYSLTAWFAILGSGPAAARMFGALATLAQGAVTLALGRAIVGRDRTKRAAIFFWPLFLLQPFTLQSSANPDIDTTIYGPLLGLVLLASVRLGRRDGRQRDDQPAKWEYLLPGLFLIAALWAKATTAIVLVAALVLFLPGSWSRRGRALFAAASGAAAMAIFATAFAIWSQLSGLDLRTSLSMLWATLLGGATGATPIEGGLLRAAVARGSEMLAFTVRWIGLLPLLVAGAVVLRPRLSGDGSADARSSRLVARLAGLALLIHLGYCAISGSFGAAPFKYVAPVWAWLVLVLSLVLSKAAAVAFADLSPRDFRRAVMLSLSVAGGAFLLGRFALRDAVLLHAATEGGTLHPQAWALWLPALGCLPWILVSGRGGRAARAAGALAVVSATLFAGSAAGIALFQTRVPYSTTYNYGQDGLAEAASFLRLHTSPGEAVVSMKDLGRRSGRRFWDNFAATAGDERAAAELITVMSSGIARYAVFTDSRGQDGIDLNPEIGAWVRTHADLVAQLGNYLIYELPASADGETNRGP